MMGENLSNDPPASDISVATLAYRQAKFTLRSFYRIGREATELGCRFDLMPGSPIVAEALKLVLEREAERGHWRDIEGITFTPADIALGMIDNSLHEQGFGLNAISSTHTLVSLMMNHQWRIVCGMVIAGRYLERDYGEVSAVVTDSAQAVVRRRCRHPSWWHDTEVREFVDSTYRQATLDQVCDMARQKFGEDRAPSRSSLNRYWMRLESKAGLDFFERRETERKQYLNRREEQKHQNGVSPQQSGSQRIPETDNGLPE